MGIHRLAASVVIGALLPGVTGLALASAASSCDDLGGNIQSGNVCHAQMITPAYIIDLRFGTDYPDDTAVSSFLIQQRDRVIGLAQAPGAQALPYQFSVMSQSFTSGQPQRTTLGYNNNAVPTDPPSGTSSLLLQIMDDNPTRRVGATYKAFNFDFDQNRPVTLDTLFAPGINPMDAVYPVVVADLARKYSTRKLTPSPPDARRFQNFAITDAAVTFYFDSGDMLPDYLGGITSTVPRAKIPPLAL
jgi:hypothetical protein